MLGLRCFLVVLTLGVSVGCGSAATAHAPARDPGGQPASTPGAIATWHRSFSGRELSGRRRNDPLWQAALDADPLQLEQLAGREGARGLLEVVHGAGTDGRIALAALEYAPDAWSALPALCQLAPRVRPSETPLVLHAIHQVAARAERIQEYVDPGGESGCLELLARLEASPTAAAEVRDLAASAAVFIEWQRGDSR